MPGYFRKSGLGSILRFFAFRLVGPETTQIGQVGQMWVSLAAVTNVREQLALQTLGLLGILLVDAEITLLGGGMSRCPASCWPTWIGSCLAQLVMLERRIS